jgi:hypothetical protein
LKERALIPASRTFSHSLKRERAKEIVPQIFPFSCLRSKWERVAEGRVRASLRVTEPGNTQIPLNYIPVMFYLFLTLAMRGLVHDGEPGWLRGGA